MELRSLGAFAGAAALALGCAPAPESPVPALTLQGTDGQPHALLDARSPFTVVEFFSAHCPCQQIHDERLRALVADYAPRGVAFVAVDAESDAAMDRDRAEAERRRYPFPILLDPEGASASALHAEFATYTLVVARDGRVLYRGGLDSDKSHLTSDATPYVRDALEDLLTGRTPARPKTEPLGCSLYRR